MGKYFTINELCVSSSYPKLVEVPAQGTTVYNNLLYLIERLDIVRENWGSPIIVTSGYRCEKLNNAVGGSKTSAHRVGMAADIHPKNGKMMDLAKLIATMDMDFDQLILEKCSIKNKEVVGCQWLHLGFSRSRNRRQILAWNGKQYIPVKITTDKKFMI